MNKVVVIGMISLGSVWAQNEGVDPHPPAVIQLRNPIGLGTVGPVSVSVGLPEAVAGAPYSATAVTEHVQVLADGNRIDQTSSETVARDSAGRTRIEHTVPGVEFGSGKPDLPAVISISDPVAGVEYLLNPADKTAMKMKRPANPTMVTNPIRVKLTAEKLAIAGLPAGQTPSKTDLGSRTIEGVSALGTQSVSIIPAGAIGNQSPIEITSENWYSPDLKITVMSKSSDPRIGDTTYTLTNVQRGEPSPSLFQIPADYTVKEGPGPNVFFSRSISAAPQP